MTQTPPPILRTEFDGTYEVYEGPWGSYLRKCRDPEANVTISKEQLDLFEIRSDIPKIPSEIWTPWIKLCFYFVDKVPSELEVSVRFLRSETDETQYRAIVPRQSVTKAAVDADDFNDSCDLVTGEKLTEYPPAGWIPIGSSHSHNTMGAFFSPTDDSSQLKDPGIHFTVGGIKTETMTYNIAASVVAQGRRFTKGFDFNNFIDATPNTDVTFHPNVLEYVDTTPRASTFSHSKFSNFTKRLPPASSSTKKHNFDSFDDYFRSKHFDDFDDFNDPYGFAETLSKTYTYNAPSKVASHNIADLINDCITENVNDTQALQDLADELKGCLEIIEIVIAS
jgi:hypothetical protein